MKKKKKKKKKKKTLFCLITLADYRDVSVTISRLCFVILIYR
jgi:hypothetical protein